MSQVYLDCFTEYVGVGTLTAGAGGILDMTGNRRLVPWEIFFIYLICASALCIILSSVVIYLNRVTYYRLTPSQRVRDQQNLMQEVIPLNIGYGIGPIDIRKSSVVAESGTGQDLIGVSRLPDDIADNLRQSAKLTD